MLVRIIGSESSQTSRGIFSFVLEVMLEAMRWLVVGFDFKASEVPFAPSFPSRRVKRVVTWIFPFFTCAHIADLFLGCCGPRLRLWSNYQERSSTLVPVILSSMALRSDLLLEADMSLLPIARDENEERGMHSGQESRTTTSQGSLALLLACPGLSRTRNKSESGITKAARTSR